jgi:hypothetical protein
VILKQRPKRAGKWRDITGKWPMNNVEDSEQNPVGICHDKILILFNRKG